MKHGKRKRFCEKEGETGGVTREGEFGICVWDSWSLNVDEWGMKEGAREKEYVCQKTQGMVRSGGTKLLLGGRYIPRQSAQTTVWRAKHNANRIGNYLNESSQQNLKVIYI